MRKPEAGFYARLLEAVDLPPDAVVFVDDRDANVAGAREVGIAAHRFEDAGRVRTWLAEHGVGVPRRAR